MGKNKSLISYEMHICYSIYVPLSSQNSHLCTEPAEGGKILGVNRYR